MTKVQNILSIDAETNGLYGDPFAVSMVFVQFRKGDGVCVIDTVQCNEWRCPVGGQPIPFVEENIIPACSSIQLTHDSLPVMLEDIWSFWRDVKAEFGDLSAIAHCGAPVETNLFRLMIELDPGIRAFNGPFPLHEVGTLLLQRGYNPTSVDDYIESISDDHVLLRKEIVGLKQHHPRYDAIHAALAWIHLI